MASMMANAASLPTIYVNYATGSDNTFANDPVTYGDGTLAHPCKRLFYALSLVGAQTTEVILAPGTYYEINIPSLSAACPNLVIRGESAGSAANTILDGSQIGYLNGRLFKTASTYETTSNNLEIRDLTFTKGGYNTKLNDAGGTMYFRQNAAGVSNNLTLTRVVFDDNLCVLCKSSKSATNLDRRFTANACINFIEYICTNWMCCSKNHF